MSWFYASDGKQMGPVSEEEFQNLRGTGAIAGETLVWREGMANWQPCAEIFAAGANDATNVPPPPPAPMKLATAGVVCTGCGGTFPMDDVVRLGDGFVCASCKPLAVQRMREGVASNDAEDIRNEHIKHEASIKSIGILYGLGAVAMLVMGVVFMFSLLGTASRAPSGQSEPAFLLGFGAIFVVLGGLQLAVAIGLRRLKPWARVVAGIFSGIGLMGFPLGTLINGYILYLLFSQKGKMVFSEEYQDVIAQTPHIKYRTSVLVWIFLGLVVFLLLFGLLAAFRG